ncbi:hypothetical protein LEL_01705 [Akanthomyces lecanii RCEF 1005]|uniref:Uncharacterized protein n=1 Tax=Akanthomyces lecanii RCEF 1005 TaxID=1081108 RepID=A0A168KU94_CORDF|nr:hypothetical protein LEL_01705 [Akanthomyces lecanii RCEF 1005]
MPARPRSVPPTLSTSTRVTRSSHANLPLPSDGLIAVHRTSTINHDPVAAAVNTTTSNAAASSSSLAGSRLAAQADALAKMTLEMNLRSVSKQADRLERELRALVRSTAQDEAFRAQHESRLQDMWKEILAVKAHVARDDNRRDTKNLADEECRRETRRVMDQMRSEVAGVREMVSGLASTLAEMPSAEQMQAALSQSSEGDAARDWQEDSGSKQQQQQRRSSSSPSIQTRIQDAIKSTRRWNRDHKTTRLGEAIFCANYFRQQSKRDARMAVFLQRSVQRRVQARFPGRPLRPHSLEDFCKVVQWTDIKAVVEELLLRNTTDVMDALQNI